MQCIKICLGLSSGQHLKGNTLIEKDSISNIPKKEDLIEDISDKEDDSKSLVAQAQATAVENTTVEACLNLNTEPDSLAKAAYMQIVPKIIKKLIEAQLIKEYAKNGGQPPEQHEIDQILQVELKLKIEELIKDSLSTDGFQKLLQGKRIDEEKIKQRLEISVTQLSRKELVKIVEAKKAKKTLLPPSKPADLLLSENEEVESDVNAKRKKKRKTKQNKSLKQNRSLKIIDNLERITGVLITARYYRGLVTTAISDYMETGWVIYYLLQPLPLFSMICGVYLVSNIGNPPRLTLRASLISGLLGEALFGVTKILYGTGSHFLTCLVCTSVAIYCWQWPTNPESTRRSNKYSSCALTFSVCVVMILVWGSIVMNTKIEVDDDEVTISEALHNFYNSPAWSQMKMSLWDTMIMYLEGNYDEASETLLRMSDLSGAERALSVLGLPRNVDEATIKARYKKLAREWHPDKYQGEDKEAASNKFIEIQQAYALLTKRIRA